MSLNLDLLEFHVREATQELDLLQDAIQYAKDGTRREGDVGDEPLRWPLREGALAASLEHAYHHLNFAWNGRFSIETRNSPVRAIRSAGSRSSGRRL